MEEVVADKATVVIVVTTADSIVGFLVDGVNDVLSIPRENIEQAPDLTRRGNGDFISGIGQHEERLVSLLEIDSLLGVGAKPL
jgi:purine-binding chemotaxis protein CheW